MIWSLCVDWNLLWSRNI